MRPRLWRHALERRHKTFKIKIVQVEATGTGRLVSACENCRLTMDESKICWTWGGDLESLVEIVADHLEDG